MGWTFNTVNQTKNDFINETLNWFSSPDSTYKIIKKSVRGNHLWVLINDTRTNTRFISLYLLSRHSGCWGYKSIDETMHPFYYDVPLNFLKLVSPPINDMSKEWRETVREKQS